MPVSPILPGRLPDTLRASRLTSLIAQQQRAMLQLQDQAATGQRYFLPSEAPKDSIRTIFFQREIERNSQLQTNVLTDQSLLTVTETSLNSVADSLNRTKSIILAGVGDLAGPDEKAALAAEIESILSGVLNTANSTHRGRYLFGGSETQDQPFTDLGGGRILYHGDSAQIDSQIDTGFLLGNNIDGATAFAALTPAVSADVDPALTTSSKLGNLFNGIGVSSLQSIEITLDDGGGTSETATVDLSTAKTIGDIEALVENAFTGALTVDVAVNGNGDGLSLTATGTATTVAVADINGGITARQLGVNSAATAAITGGDLNPALSLRTPLADLNGGAAATFTDGLVITSGTRSVTVDLSGATDVEDILNEIELQARAADIHVEAGINEQGNGISIRSRVSGEPFSIGENGGDDAASLGIRTLTGSTLLADLNNGLGVPTGDGNTLDITRRDGTDVSIDLSTAATIQDVLDLVNAVDPGVLTASLNSVGNGISFVDDDGLSTGDLIVAENALSTALGVAGEETSGTTTGVLSGEDINRQETAGVFNLLVQTAEALRNGDDAELTRLGGRIDGELSRFAAVRNEVAARLQTLDQIEERLLDTELTLNQSLSETFDADLTEVITKVTELQTSLQATLQISSISMQLNLINFI
ncbi:flagellar hook-associated protein FlgL [Stratiformator vulcanicus]|uniref:Flagellar hook-associated protein 3 n=1 Tax=Stratiformator vulcanicus TaxID=2527980 RepID=A0A517R423_9PLAN|nr:flagellar hook-associated protein FlgL [Stratiformator vulcanicus]QDT38583.1 Flagellar hook-associated protein 3 [Stratiformator vulcanicus]